MPTLSVPHRTLPLLCAAALVLALALGACGQKGALYHPEPVAPAEQKDAAPDTEKDKDAKKDTTERDDDRAPR